jgi:hypothetical protein
MNVIMSQILLLEPSINIFPIPDEKKGFEELVNYVISCHHKKIGPVAGQSGC